MVETKQIDVWNNRSWVFPTEFRAQQLFTQFDIKELWADNIKTAHQTEQVKSVHELQEIFRKTQDR